MREEMQQLQTENKRLQERVAMLQHTQLLHNEAAQAEAVKKGRAGCSRQDCCRER